MGNHQTVTTTSIKVEGRSLEQKLEANANLEKKDRKCVGREVCRVRNGCGQKEQNERRMGIGAGGLRWREDVLTHQDGCGGRMPTKRRSRDGWGSPEAEAAPRVMDGDRRRRRRRRSRRRRLAGWMETAAVAGGRDRSVKMARAV
ncbi:Os06g0665150 [Oryza sativa Japonica Group]|jgi:hypothetical protein|uniref:Os06g0665150 protein n=3 Tax=Oryza TaxID=4527 RepID=Q655Y2_ORYSJ|nr:hypothetical protein [Oryza sativa Japonica Group]BAS99027.1 Os06g0665150 [Oryza sativa Japonica Group]